MAQLKDLNDDCLLDVLDLLPPKKMFKIMGVDKRFNRLARDKLRTNIKAIALTYFPSNELTNLFSNCSHLGAIKRNQVLVFSDNLREQAHFLNVLAKCSGIRAFDLECFDFSIDTLIEVVRLCPEFECIKLYSPVVEDGDNWDRVLDAIGNKIVHFEFTRRGYLSVESRETLAKADNRLFLSLAAKCPNIKQLRVNLYLNYDEYLIDVLVTAFKSLPKSCWIALTCNSFKWFEDEIIPDLFDELSIYETLDLFKVGRRYDRLTKLEMHSCIGQAFDGVDFAALKKLKVRIIDSRDSIDSLISSRFPSLEEFSFNLSNFYEADYDRLFQRMPSVKKLTVDYDYENNPLLPKSAIRRLNKLEKLKINIFIVPEDWRVKKITKHLEHYVVGISSLKKLTVNADPWEDDEIVMALSAEFDQLKIQQNRVEIIFKCFGRI